MFKIAKYYLLVSIVRRAKKNFLMILISMLGMILTSFLFADLIGVMDSGSKYILVAIKWLILISLLMLVALNMLKIVNIVSEPFKKESKEPRDDIKKEKILAKEHLLSRSELILNKYRNKV